MFFIINKFANLVNNKFMAIIGRKETTNYYEKEYNVNYYNVRNTAWEFLIKNNITSYPLDLHKIIDNNHWAVMSYKKYAQLHQVPLEDLFLNSTDGFTTVDDDNNYLIVINEQNNEQRNRFTICHEIGHIILHKTFQDSKQLEKEANMFAARILMPIILIKELNIDSPEVLASLCNVSLESANFRLKRFNKIQSREKFYTNPLEIQVFEQLKPFLDKIKI